MILNYIIYLTGYFIIKKSFFSPNCIKLIYTAHPSITPMSTYTFSFFYSLCSTPTLPLIYLYFILSFLITSIHHIFILQFVPTLYSYFVLPFSPLTNIVFYFIRILMDNNIVKLEKYTFVIIFVF